MAVNPALAFRPARYGESLRDRPRWVAAFAVLAVLFIALGILSDSVRTEDTVSHLPPGASAAARREARDALRETILIRSLFLPVRLFAGWSLFALALAYACGIWRTRSPMRFAQVFGAVVYSEFPLFLAGAAALIAASSGGRAGPPGPLLVPGGLDLFIHTGDFTALYVLNSVNIFSAGHFVLLAVTLSGATGLSRPKAAISSLLVWATAMFVNAAITRALLSEFHFSL